MSKHLFLTAILLITFLPPPIPALAQGLTCQASGSHAVYLPFILGDAPVPKAELQRRIDNLPGDFEFFDTSFLDPTREIPIDIPTGISVAAVQDGILVKVDPAIDTSHLHPRFQSYILHVRQAGSTDAVGMYTAEFSDMSIVWSPPYGGYIGWDIALTAVTNTGTESDYSDWYRCVLSTFHDAFDGYGGELTNDQESLYWLKIADFDTDEDWTSPTVPAATLSSAATTLEGNRTLQVDAEKGGAGPYTATVRLTKAMDLSGDGRFGDDDYVCIYIYISNAAAIGVLSPVIGFYTDVANYYYTDLHTLVSAGHNYLAIKKSDFGTSGAPDWSDITFIQIDSNSDASTDYYIQLDDWRIVKADPADAGAFNDTGAAWDFSDGVWHVYPGKRPGEPSFDYSLGQIEGPSGDYDDFMAVVQNVEMPSNKLSAGVYLKGGNGRAGIAFRIEDDTLGSEDALLAEVNSTTGIAQLVRYTAGVRSTLASVVVANTPLGLTIAPNRTIWIGVDFRDLDNEDRVKMYLSASEAQLFNATHLVLSHAATAPWPDGQQVGLISYSANVRFSEFRAGSPQTADYAHRAGHALTAGASVEDYGAAVAGRVALPSTVGAWSMSSVQRSTGNVYDSTPQGRTLTYNGNPEFDFLNSGAPFINLDGTGDYLARTDETDLDVLGTETLVAAARRGLTLICWAYTTTANTEHVIGKWTAGTNNRSYRIVNAAGTWQGQVSTDGSASTTVSGDSADTDRWWFLALRFDPSATLDLWCGTGLSVVKYSNSTSIPASIFNGNADFRIGAEGGGGNLLTGYGGLSSLHFAALDDEVIERVFQRERALYA